MNDDALIKKNITTYLKRHQEKELLRFSTAGSVDDGKSTLIGRLLHDTNAVYEDQLVGARKSTKASDVGEIDFSLLTDGLKAEREQGITIDVAYRYFTTSKRKFIIADTPGHVQYTRNMATGASTADLAIVLIDARLGVQPQSRRHAFIASLLGIPKILVAINKMDLKNYSEDVFKKIKNDFSKMTEEMDFEEVVYFPVSALKGDNVAVKSKKMPWFRDGTILNYLETTPIIRHTLKKEFFFPVQYVLRPNINFRGYAGQIASGTIKKGDKIVVLPSGKTNRVKSIVTYDGNLKIAGEPQSVALTLEHEVDVSRGDVLAHKEDNFQVTQSIEATIVWMHETPLTLGKQYWIKHTSNLVTGTLETIHHSINNETFEKEKTDRLKLNEIGKITLSINRPLVVDLYKNNRIAGAFIVIDRLTNITVGAGMITGYGKSNNIVWHHGKLDSQRREKQLKQKGAVIWFTGFSGSGKSTVAREVELALVENGKNAYVLDGDNIRHGLNNNLGFSPEDRKENIRRIGEVAKLFCEANVITLTAFISPYRADRELARSLVPEKQFFEIFCEASLEECEKRDPKGLYKKARSGEISEFTGISAPYEVPSSPDLVLKTGKEKLEESARKVLKMLAEKGVL